MISDCFKKLLGGYIDDPEVAALFQIIVTGKNLFCVYHNILVFESMSCCQMDRGNTAAVNDISVEPDQVPQRGADPHHQPGQDDCRSVWISAIPP